MKTIVDFEVPVAKDFGIITGSTAAFSIANSNRVSVSKKSLSQSPYPSTLLKRYSQLKPTRAKL